MVGEGGDVLFFYLFKLFIFYIMVCVSMLPLILLLLNVTVLYVYLIVLSELLVCLNDRVKLFKTTKNIYIFILCIFSILGILL